MQNQVNVETIASIQEILADKGWLVAETPAEGDIVTGYEEGQEFMKYSGGWVIHVAKATEDLTCSAWFRNNITGETHGAVPAQATNLPSYWEL